MYFSLVGNYLRPSNNYRPLNFNINAVVLIVIMLVMSKKSNLFDSVDYQNAVPTMNFLSIFTHARDRYFVTSEYVTEKWLWP